MPRSVYRPPSSAAIAPDADSAQLSAAGFVRLPVYVLMRSGSRDVVYRYELLYAPDADPKVECPIHSVYVYKLSPAAFGASEVVGLPRPGDVPFDRSSPDYVLVPPDFAHPSPGPALPDGSLVTPCRSLIHTGPTCQGFAYRQSCKHVDVGLALCMCVSDLHWFLQASQSLPTRAISEADVLSGSFARALALLRSRSQG